MAMGSSSCRDRTAEFDAVVDRFKINLHGQAPTSSSSSSSSTPSSVSNSSSNRFDFNREASRIGLSIQDAEKKLSRLSKLTKRSSMFDDPTREIQELTVVMSQDLTWLNSSIQQLESNDILRSDMSSQNFEHCKTIVENLKGRLMQITSGFKEVLTTRTEHLKVHENRRQLFTAAPASEKSGANALNSSIGNETSSNHTPPPWAKSLSSQTSISRNAVSDTSTSTQLRRRTGGVASFSPIQTQMQMQQEAIPLLDHNRSSALHAVESTIAELSGMFTQVATLVSQQGELAIRIDDNMEDTLGNVKGAQGNLLKYLHRITSNRWLIVKIFIVLIVFLMVFILFLA